MYDDYLQQFRNQVNIAHIRYINYYQNIVCRILSKKIPDEVVRSALLSYVIPTKKSFLGNCKGWFCYPNSEGSFLFSEYILTSYHEYTQATYHLKLQLFQVVKQKTILELTASEGNQRKCIYQILKIIHKGQIADSILKRILRHP